MKTQNRVLLISSFIVTSLSLEAGLFCGGETKVTKTKILVQVNTQGNLSRVVDGSVDIILKDGNVDKSYALSSDEIVNFYEGCRNVGPSGSCDTVMLGLRAFDGSSFPVNVSFVGPDYSTTTVQARSRIDSLLLDGNRKKLSGNKMKVSKKTPTDLNDSYEFEDVVCVMTPDT